MKQKDQKLLDKVVNEIKKVDGVKAIAQTGSSLYSEDYNDIDLIVFYKDFLPPPKLSKIQNKYNKTKISIETRSSAKKYKIIGGMKLFIKHFQRDKKKILYGKDPYKNKNIKLKKLDVAHFIWYMHHIPDYYNENHESALPASLIAMLAYKNIFPKDKHEALEKFKSAYPKLYKHLPKNPEKHLRNTNKSNFQELYPFFEACLKHFVD
ncbi:MAG: hypothetical protein ABEI74_00400 [Candidatus Pacearchaeota archaeon]